MSEVSIKSLNDKLNVKIEEYMKIEEKGNGMQCNDDSNLDIEERIEKLEGVFDLRVEYKKVIENKSKQEEEIIMNIEELRNEMNKIHENTKNQINNYVSNYNELIDERIKLERIKWDAKTKENPKKKPVFEAEFELAEEEWEGKKIGERKGKIIEKGECGNNVYYELYENGKMFIDGNGNMNDYKYNDTNDSINTPWYSKSENIEEIIIQNGVSSIGDYCFSWCSKLSTINIPSSVSSIGHGCFINCSNLNSINIPTSVSSIGDFCFDYCDNLSAITIPTSVSSLGQYSFCGCANLSTINIPSSVTFIGNDCFSCCIRLEGNIQIDPNNPAFRTDGTSIYEKGTDRELYYVWNSL